MFPGHKICHLRNNNHRLRSGVAQGECDNTLERTNPALYWRRSSVLMCPACDMPSFVPCLQENIYKNYVGAMEAAKRPNKKISSCAIDTDVVVLVIPVV